MKNYFALCPLDGRYSNIEKEFSSYFSEYALVKNRVKVEICWLIFLIKELKNSNILNSFNGNLQKIEDIYNNFSENDYLKVKEIENITNHDVKAVELFIGKKLKELKYDSLVSFVHIGCTSEDINNTAYANMINEVLEFVWIPCAKNLINKISDFSNKTLDIPMLAHTHGQPATPTTVGKEFIVFLHRFKNAINYIRDFKVSAKFNGATGNYSAINIAFPEVAWTKMSKIFVEQYLHLSFNPITTQIENHDYICHISNFIRHFNNVLLDFDRDIWLYISMQYLKQIPVKNEVGSSTMPHKINPIKFENSEANIDMSNAIFMALSNKLPISRLQRDLSDSSSKRNIGLAFGYSVQAIEQTISGLEKVDVNISKISADLDNNWEVLAEPIQTVLRKYSIPDAYNQLKDLTRGKKISKEIIHNFINSLDIISNEDKTILLNLTPSNYIGLASQITKNELKS